MFNYSKDQILKYVSICDVAKKFDIPLLNVGVGNFTHKCKCPSKNHKHGNENTSSLFIDSRKNNFYCFGCGANYNVIDFYLICSNLSFSDAMTELRLMIDPDIVSEVKESVRSNNYDILLDISELFRNNIKKHKEDIDWIMDSMFKTDKYISELKSDDIKNAMRLYNKVKFLFKKRYEK